MLGRLNASGFFTAILLASCSGGSGGGVMAVVKFGSGAASKCVVVQATSATGFSARSGAIARGTKTSLSVGVASSDELYGTVKVQALGFSTEACTGGTQIETSAEVEAALTLPVSPVELTLEANTTEDADQDGYPKSTDCNDGNATVHPGAMEQCGNFVDDDCDSDFDCADSDCMSASCDDLDACTTADVCTSTGCHGTAKVCNQPGFCETATGATCSNGTCVYAPSLGMACPDGGVCRSDRTCGFGEVNCGNGIDDDGDGGADCADPACAAQTCDAGVLLCFDRATCQASGCAPLQTSMKACTEPAGGCFASIGCSADAGCLRTQSAVGASCTGGSCRPDGGCGPVESATLCANGSDDDVDGLTDCADPGCAGAVCMGGGVCTATGCYLDAGVPDAGPPDAGPRDSGTPPTADAGSDAGFPFVPTNFDPAAIPGVNIGGNVRLNNCTAIFNSTMGMWTQACSQPVGTPTLIMQPGNEPAYVLPMRSLTIDANAQLRLTGSVPVIVVVFGDVDLNGNVSATTNDIGNGTALGAGGNWPGCAAAQMNGNPSTMSTSGGGGGAFASDGGNGGGANGGRGGTPQPSTLSPLHGGCRGASGGGDAGSGGGGGAIQLSVAGTYAAAGWITAAGGGAPGAPPSRGGGGGGSGGAIFVEASAIDLQNSARMTVNGGGGAEGGGQNDPGFDGQDGRTASTAAQGGFGNSNGGNGAAIGAPAQNGGTDSNSTGGGGGGVGYLRLRAINGCVTNNATFSGVLLKTPNCP